MPFEVMITVIAIVVGLPWLIFHYVTKWKTSATLTGSDEKLLDELYELARRLDDRLCSIERIMAADDPNWKQKCTPESPRLGSSMNEMDLDAELARLSARTREREIR